MICNLAFQRELPHVYLEDIVNPIPLKWESL